MWGMCPLKYDKYIDFMVASHWAVGRVVRKVQCVNEGAQSLKYGVLTVILPCVSAGRRLGPHTEPRHIRLKNIFDQVITNGKASTRFDGACKA